LSSIEPGQLAARLKAASATEVKILADAFMSSSLEDFLGQSGIKTIWVEYHPDLYSFAPETFLARLTELERQCRCIPITGDLTLLQMLSRQERWPTALALKGSEAAGFVSSESTNMLYGAARRILAQPGRELDLIIWGGIATPEAAGAFLATGVRGIVCESLHWQTDLVAAGENQREFLARLQPEHTSVVGSSLGVCCRLFDKGNSLAVKEAEDYARSLLDSPVTPQKRQALGRYLTKALVAPLDNDDNRRQLIPLGPEAGFASWFVERFGSSTTKALQGFLSEINRLLAEAPNRKNIFIQSQAAQALGTRYPFIQGAMTWISDQPAFALQVAEAGALPTIALGLRNYEQLEEDLSSLKSLMAGRPYAVNLIALPENPFLEDQLAWIKQTLPPFVAIAAGPPTQAVRLRQEGLEPIYITADIGLMRLALEGGVRWIVLEGSEAGGHVGAHSSLMLAQMALELKWREPELFQGRYIMLAGGIYNRETAFRAALLGVDGLQMGTAYLATREIVATGALTRLYQDMIVSSPPGMTVVSGESLGFRVRSLRNAKMEAILALEMEYQAGKEDEASFRRRLESVSAKSLLLAAQGRNHPGGPPLDEETCRQDGQFMSGADAGLIDRVVSLKEFHQELAAGHLELLQENYMAGSVKVRQSQGKGGDRRERVAVTGIAQVNSLGNNPQEIWQAALAMKSGVITIPPSKWDHSKVYDPTPGTPEKTYCQVGAFHNITISRKELGIPPQDFRTMSHSTRLTMYLAHQAIMDSGILDSDIPRERIAVIISQNSGESANTLTDLVISLSAPKIVHALRGLLPLTPEMELLAENLIKSGHLTVDDTTLLGRLNSAAGGFISNKYGLRGPCYSVSAACATSLVAIHTAIQMINNGTIDAAIVGGGEENLTPAHFVEFSALGALAGISGVKRSPQELSRPFDAGRDGFVLGEGGAMVVLERESLAQKRGARINAFIVGVGASNNDLGMVESVAATQKLALEASFADLPYGPEHIDLIECHATGTVQGDIEEVKTLESFFSNHRRTILTSFKSQIGHTLGASGVISMIQGIKALQEGIFPGTLNYQEPDPGIDLEEAGFYLPTQPLAWPRPHNAPRRLMVNAFGFGGANYVVHLEEALADSAPVLISSPDFSEAGPQDDKSGLTGLAFFRANLAGSQCRVGVVAPDEPTAQQKIITLPPVKSPLSAPALRTLANQGIFVGREGDSVPPLAFVFAGQGTFYPGMGRELYADFPLIREWMDRVAALAEFDLLDRLFHAQEEELTKTLWQQPALFTLEYALVQLLLSLGLQPVAMAGHSMGELTALSVAGVFSFEDAFRIINKRAQCMDKAGSLNQDPGAMIAVDVPMEILTQKVSQREQVYFTNYNSPRQIILGGATEEILALKDEIAQEGYWTVQLRVSMAFHSPIMKPVCDEICEFIKGVEMHPPQIPVISNTTQKPYPDDPEEIKKIILAHLENPVHWMQNVQTLWDDFGIRTFVEVGPKDTLCNLIADTIEGATCLKTSYPENESYTCRAALAQLFALGHLTPPQPPTWMDFPSLTPVNIARPVAIPRVSSSSPPQTSAADVVQREINAFVLDTFGKFLKPTILAALRQKIDPAFTEEQLGELLKTFTGSAVNLDSASYPPAGSTLSGTDRVQGTSTLPIGAAGPPSTPCATALVKEGDYLEHLIQIIMDATGYERYEIEPHMDIRTDLSIRSSRLPIIMDAAERQFGIKVKLEDFIGLRTVQELADRIACVRARDGSRQPDQAVPVEATLQPDSNSPLSSATPSPAAEVRELKRLIIQEIPLLEESLLHPVKVKIGQEVAVLSFDVESELTVGVADFLRQEMQLLPILLDIAEEYDLRSPAGTERTVQRLHESKNLAGLILVLDQRAEVVFTAMEEIPALLTGIFCSLQILMRFPTKKFYLSIQQDLHPAAAATVAAQGVVGMFLDAALEYDSVLFRSLTLDRETDLKIALTRTLDQTNSLAQLVYHGPQAFALEARHGSVLSSYLPDLSLKSGDVIVISGGGQGISPHLGFALAPFNPRLVLLGRSALDSSDDIKQSLEEFSRLGMDATYYSCDVTNQGKVKEVLAAVVARFGRIDGLIHGAGVLHDAFIEFMSVEDFATVVEVKFSGAWNLYQAACHQGLRFMVMLSSVTAIQGNIGQINYCAANRAMSALAQVIAARQPEIKAKALMLPPIDGVGMAAAAEMKELIKLKGWEGAYIHINELAELFCRELFLGPAAEPWVMPIRNLPPVKTTRINLHEPEPLNKCLTVAGMAFPDYEFPMIQTVRRVDLDQGLLEAERNFSQEHDLWINDHRPFKFLKNPFVSGIMAIETFMEAAHLLYPHLKPLGIRQVVYQDIVECPPDIDRQTLIVCRRQETNGFPYSEIHCQVAISSSDITPTGRVVDRWSTNYVGEVILGNGSSPLLLLPGFPINPEELKTSFFSHDEVTRFYKKYSNFQGRYRIIEQIDGAGLGIARGQTIYKYYEDFANMNGFRYQYSPYLLEGIKHLVNCYLLLWDEDIFQAMIPYKIGEMRFTRLCRPNEPIILEGRLLSNTEDGNIWDAQALAADGEVIMQVQGLHFKPFAA
jgi:acyl transferase domain-containing protein/NAD(P)H-dependent flavin oxidoreductase YrpB (nitropropane dioxygenase family)/NAD(P)-dependent dehydrogenase (short-subunit alcohol dehydrogenase family)/acyl carrier protein/3-hydroxymyristoyl/3-hydroxydecanoyl-(acyl carrier protein) dehydratase